MHIYWFELVAGRIVFSITFPSELHSMCYWWSLLRVVPASVKTGCGITDSLLLEPLQPGSCAQLRCPSLSERQPLPERLERALLLDRRLYQLLTKLSLRILVMILATRWWAKHAPRVAVTVGTEGVPRRSAMKYDSVLTVMASTSQNAPRSDCYNAALILACGG